MPVAVIGRTLLIFLVTFGKKRVLGQAVVKYTIKLTPARRSRVYGDPRLLDAQVLINPRFWLIIGTRPKGMPA